MDGVRTLSLLIKPGHDRMGDEGRPKKRKFLLDDYSPVAILATMMAAPIPSAGRFSPRGPLGIAPPKQPAQEKGGDASQGIEQRASPQPRYPALVIAVGRHVAGPTL